MKKIFFILCAFMVFSINCRSEEMTISPYEIEGKIGFINSERKKITEAEFPSFNEVYISKKIAIVNNNDGINLITGKGKKIVGAPKYYKKGIIGDDFFYVSFANNFYSIIFDIEGRQVKIIPDLVLQPSKSIDFIPVTYYTPATKRNYVTWDGKLLFNDPDFIRVYSYSDQFKVAVIQDSEFDCRIINEKGEFLSNMTWNYLCTEIEDDLLFGVTFTEKGYFDFFGNLKIKVNTIEGTMYDDYYVIPSFSSGVAPFVLIDDELYSISLSQHYQSNNWVIMDKEKNIFAKNIKAKSIGPFHSNVAVIKDESKCGIIDKTGKMIVPLEYDFIRPFINGYARAIKNGTDYIISTTGEVIKCKDLK